MHAPAPSQDQVRQLAGWRAEHGQVLSVYFDLDPSVYPTGEARASQLGSVLDEAGRAIDAADLDHDARVQLRADVDRLRAELDPQSMGAGGAQGLAAFASGDALFELVRVSEPVPTHVSFGPAPHVAPLAMVGRADRWCVVITASAETRVLLGTAEGLEEGTPLRDTDPQLARGDKDLIEQRRAHARHVAGELAALLKADAYDALLVSGAQPAESELIEALDAEVRARLAGTFGVEPHQDPAAVLEAARPTFHERRLERQREAFSRLRAGIGRDDGRAAGGAVDVLAALEQRRVEVLLVDPVVFTDAEVLGRAVALALEQDAEILRTLNEAPDLGPHGGLAALLRF